MQFALQPHRQTPPVGSPFKVWVNIDHANSLGAVASTNIWFCVGAPAERFAMPIAAAGGRADNLWETTCFEVFLKAPGSVAYREWNFAPSGQWAAFDLADYRAGRTDADVAAPYVRMEDNLTWWAVGATIATDSQRELQIGLSAILEEKGGAKSYWALAHPAGEPDFHDPVCFAARLA